MAKKKQTPTERPRVLGRNPLEGLEIDLPPDEPKRKTLGRNPLEDVVWPPEPVQEILYESVEETTPEPSTLEQSPVATSEPVPSVTQETIPSTGAVVQPTSEPRPLIRLQDVPTTTPAGELRGKGVWLLYSHEIDRAIEIALAIGATHIIYKTGDRGIFFVEAAHRVYHRVREAGLVPFSWTSIYCNDPILEAETIVKSARMGYEGVVLDVEHQASEKGIAITALGQRLLQAGIHPSRLFYTSLPDIGQHLDLPYLELNAFCRGGFMPQCYPTHQQSPRTVITEWAYGEYENWALEWGNMPPLYPVLATHKDERATLLLGVEEFLQWAQELALHAPSFYSLYRAGITKPELWSILAALGEEPPVPSPPGEVTSVPSSPQPTPPAPQPQAKEAPPSSAIYYVMTVNDTVWSIYNQYNITREQFWAWNGHLWDERWLPRDDIYIQEGWRVRVG